MLNQQTIEKLHAMKLHGMADAFHAQLETRRISGSLDSRVVISRGTDLSAVLVSTSLLSQTLSADVRSNFGNRV